jgi:hypothetical protein
VHSPEDEAKAAQWLREILDPPSDEYYEGAFDKPGSGGEIERLLWEINDLGATVTCVSDQWVRVDAKGTVKGQTVETQIQGDTFLLALAETFRWWRDFVRG